MKRGSIVLIKETLPSHLSSSPSAQDVSRKDTYLPTLLFRFFFLFFFVWDNSAGSIMPFFFLLLECKSYHSYGTSLSPIRNKFSTTPVVIIVSLDIFPIWRFWALTFIISIQYYAVKISSHIPAKNSEEMWGHTIWWYCQDQPCGLVFLLQNSFIYVHMFIHPLVDKWVSRAT